MAVMAAGMHAAGVLRAVLEVVALFDMKCIQVRAQADRTRTITRFQGANNAGDGQAAINYPAETEFAAQAAARVVGAENVLRDEPPIMAAEDFAWMLLEKQGSYVWIGNGPEHQGGCMLHNPGYDFNDRILPTGASYWVELTESWLR